MEIVCDPSSIESPCWPHSNLTSSLSTRDMPVYSTVMDRHGRSIDRDAGYEWIAACITCGLADLSARSDELGQLRPIVARWRCVSCGGSDSVLVTAATLPAMVRAAQAEERPGDVAEGLEAGGVNDTGPVPWPIAAVS